MYFKTIALDLMDGIEETKNRSGEKYCSNVEATDIIPIRNSIQLTT